MTWNPSPALSRSALASFALAIALGGSTSPAAPESRSFLFRGSFDGGNGPTTSHRYIEPGVLFLPTEKVSGTTITPLGSGRIWNVDSGILIYGDLFDSETLPALDYHPGSRRVIVSDRKSQIGIYSIDEERLVKTFPLIAFKNVCRFSDDGKSCLFIDQRGSGKIARLFNLDSGETIWQSTAPIGAGRGSEFSHFENGNRLVRVDSTTVSGNKTVTYQAINGADGSTISQSSEELQRQLSLFDRQGSGVEGPLYAFARGPGDTVCYNAINDRTFTTGIDNSGPYYQYSMAPNGSTFALLQVGQNRFTLHDGNTGATLADLTLERTRRGLGTIDTPRAWFGYSPDGKTLYQTDQDGTLTEWSASPFAFIRKIGTDPEYSKIDAMSSDGGYFTSFVSDNTIRIWNASDGSAALTHSPSNRLWYARILPDNKTLVVVEQGGAIKSYSLPSGEFSRSLPDGNGIAYANRHIDSLAKSIVVYQNGAIEALDDDASSSTTIGTLPYQIGAFYDIDPRNAQLLLATSLREYITIYDPFERTENWRISNPLRVVDSATLHSQPGKTIVALSGWLLTNQYGIRLYDTNSSAELRSIATNSKVEFLSISPNGQWLAYLDGFSTLKVLAVDGSSEPRTISPIAAHFAFSPDSTKLLYLSEPSNKYTLSLATVDVATGTPTGPEIPIGGTFYGIYRPTATLAVSSDGAIAAVAADNNQLILIDLANNRELTRVESRYFAHTGSYYTSSAVRRYLSFSSDHKRLLLQDSNGLINDWNLVEGQSQPLQFSMLESTNASVRFGANPSKDYLIESSSDLREWKLASIIRDGNGGTHSLPIKLSADPLYLRLFDFPKP